MNTLFYDNFKRICQEKDIPRYKVMKDCDLACNKIQLWKGGSIPKASVLIILARYLNCDVADFFLEPNSPNNANKITESTLDEDEKDIINYYRSLSRQQKHMFLSSLYQQMSDKNGK